MDFLTLTPQNLANEHLCCIIRSRKIHEGVEAKRAWLSEQLNDGHIFRKLNAKACVFVEYAPLESAWTPIVGENYFYLYCLWVDGEYKGKGLGRALMESCLNDAKEKGKSGVCMLGAKRQKHWLSNQSFAKKFGFEVVDSTANGYELLALSFDDTAPKFAPNAKQCTIDNQELTIYYSLQCPYILQNIQMIENYCTAHNICASFVQVDSLQKAKELPCVFNNFAVFYKGQFATINLLDIPTLQRIFKR
ncbi:GNAT family N-acetyltransferase [Helicobacter sp. MIT 11-5569]|uniref:GNAT family N-acetyltransferase n=1 Tax=Helicobacter sp. MIT 11-5569 TaxID=1548151 RepID=UPI00051F8F17|nr:GNAT family N-acetyltransferase [Helicobacter sp. MIT 11-5569]TLD85065.1 GNAT family N-acetyltransferase [Helicobacter sp. MIT 11-5569]